MTKPFFSILIPTFNRPEMVHFAIESVLLQNFQDFELIISNNGALTSTRDVVSKYLNDERVKYYESSQVLSMVEHWDKVGKLFVGKYFLILTDRCLLKQDSLNFLYKTLFKNDQEIEVISWPWDLYLNELNILLKSKSEYENEIIKIDSTEYLRTQAENMGGVDYPMPRGMNSCIDGIFYQRLLRKYLTVFVPISPDVSFSYYCLMNTRSFWYVQRALMISQGASISNGGQAYVSTTEKYTRSLNIENPIQILPCKVPFLVNAVAEDLLTTAIRCNRMDIYNAFCKTNYYVKLLSEWDAKFIAHKISFFKLFLLMRQIKTALYNESNIIQYQVQLQRKQMKSNKLLMFFRRIFVASTIGLLGGYSISFRQQRALRSGSAMKFNDAKEAAGFN